MSSKPAEIKPAYLICGTDEAKISRTRARLRARAEREGGSGALELFEAGQGRKAPDADALTGSVMAISLMASRRYLLADGVEGWGKKDLEQVAEALAAIPPDTTIALVAHGKAPAALKKAVEAAGGEVLAFEAPKEREMPKRLVADARELGLHPRDRRRAGCSSSGWARGPSGSAPSSSGSRSGRARAAPSAPRTWTR